MKKPIYSQPLHFAGLALILSIFLLGVTDAFYQNWAAASPAAPSTSVTLYPTQDTWIAENQPSATHGGSPSLIVGGDEFLQESYALVQFDISSIPDAATINSAYLELYLNYADAGSRTLCMHRVTSSWSDNVTWNTRPSHFTTCYSPTSVGITSNYYIRWADVWAPVNWWHRNFAPNHGLAVKLQNKAYGYKFFDSREDSHRPRLVVNYSLPTSTPTPTRTQTPTLPPTRTKTPTPTFTRTPTRIPNATDTPTFTPRPATNTPTRTPTRTLTPSPTITLTPAPTDTRTPTPQPRSSISGVVWHDRNHNGVVDIGEEGLSGARVELTGYPGVLFASRTTGSGGGYSFDNLEANTYGVHVDPWTLPLGYVLVSGDETWARYVPPGAHFDVNFGYAPGPTPTPLPPETADLYFHSLEFVQVNSGSSMQFEGVPTMVRVYVGVRNTDQAVYNVTGRLMRLDRAGGWNEALRSDNSILVYPSPNPAVRNRHWIMGTLNFTLPADWLRGSYDVNVWINYDHTARECLGCVDNNIGYHPGVRFARSRPLDLGLVRIQTGGRTTSNAQIVGVMRDAAAYFPTNAIRPFFSANPTLAASRNYSETITSGRCGPNWNRLLADLTRLHRLTGADNRVKFYGALPVGTNGGQIGGCGSTPGVAAAGLVSQGGATMAHEIIHNIGRRHVASVKLDSTGNNVCTNPGTVDTRYPNSTGKLDGYGLDQRQSPPRIYREALTWDVMSYCAPRWMSAFTFQGMWDDYFDPSDVQAAATESTQVSPQRLQAEGRFLLIHLLFDEHDLAEFYPVYHLALDDGPHDHPGQGDYSIELEDVAGNNLFTRRFEVEETHDVMNTTHPESNPLIEEIVPEPPDVAAIVVKHGQEEIGRRTFTAHAPQVTLISPNGGENWAANGETTIRWRGSDADGDSLTYTVYYVTGNFDTYSALVVDTTATRLKIDLAELPGSDRARIWIIANDGTLTGNDVSDAFFTVPDKGPQVWLLEPQEGQSFLPGAVVPLRVVAGDREDGETTDERIQWSSDRNGLIGSGQIASVQVLESGWHTITATVRDSGGLTTSQNVSILVGYRNLLPALLR